MASSGYPYKLSRGEERRLVSNLKRSTASHLTPGNAHVKNPSIAAGSEITQAKSVRESSDDSIGFTRVAEPSIGNSRDVRQSAGKRQLASANETVRKTSATGPNSGDAATPADGKKTRRGQHGNDAVSASGRGPCASATGRYSDSVEPAGRQPAAEVNQAVASRDGGVSRNPVARTRLAPTFSASHVPPAAADSGAMASHSDLPQNISLSQQRPAAPGGNQIRATSSPMTDLAERKDRRLRQKPRPWLRADSSEDECADRGDERLGSERRRSRTSPDNNDSFEETDNTTSGYDQSSSDSSATTPEDAGGAAGDCPDSDYLASLSSEQLEGLVSQSPGSDVPPTHLQYRGSAARPFTGRSQPSGAEAAAATDFGTPDAAGDDLAEQIELEKTLEASLAFTRSQRRSAQSRSVPLPASRAQNAGTQRTSKQPQATVKSVAKVAPSLGLASTERRHQQQKQQEYLSDVEPRLPSSKDNIDFDRIQTRVMHEVKAHNLKSDWSTRPEQFLDPSDGIQYAHGCEHSESLEFDGLLLDFGGYRLPQQGDAEWTDSNVMIRPMPFYSCLHRLPVSEADKRGRVHARAWDEASGRAVVSSDITVPVRYAVCVRGPLELDDGVNAEVEIEGPGKAAAENIARICRSLEFRAYKTYGDPALQEVRIDIRVLEETDAVNCLNAIRDQIHGMYYRREATRLEEWRVRFRDLAPREGSSFTNAKSWYGCAMNAAHQLAAKSIFNFYNFARSPSQVDLHHLRVHHREAEAHLKQAMVGISEMAVDSRESEKYLEVIAGKGIHSRDNQDGRLVKEVKRLLRAWHKQPPSGVSHYIQVREVNQGSFLVLFAPYNGPSPCFGVFYCHIAEDDEDTEFTQWQRPCHHTWDSIRVFVDIDKRTQKPVKNWRQRCYRCFKRNDRMDVECLRWMEPVMLSQRRPSHRLGRLFVMEYSDNAHRTYATHDPELCELCLHLQRTGNGQKSCDTLPRAIRYR
eukprot:scpid33529/ scgid6496/ 